MAIKRPIASPPVGVPVPPLSSCLAKTTTLADGTVGEGFDVLTHCMAVGLVARELIARSPVWVREALFPAGSELVAAAHDVGKVCPTFQKRLHEAVHGPDVRWASVDSELEALWGRHAGVSEAALEGVGKFIPQIAGRHHGTSPELGPRHKDSEAFGGPAWQARREELIDALKLQLGVGWPVVKDEVQALVLSGLTTVADWIGSGSSFDRPEAVSAQGAKVAVDQAGIQLPQVIPGLSFQSIFPFSPTPAQSQFADVCRGPGVYILEAPMGQGKTEAALYAAYRALEAGQATGIYFALPTQLTSNRIHTRLQDFLNGVYGGSAAAGLVHAGAALVETDWGEEAGPGGSWFTSTKRGLLAPFAVGTVDQALMAVLNVRHGFVRAYGLAGKVVVLDEVHSYDSYTGTILEVLVRTLVELRCTVIVLSATLTRDRRGAFLENPTFHCEHDSYPLVTAQERRGPATTVEFPPPERRVVRLRCSDDTDAAVDEALARVEGGQFVLWIENTVAEAQDRFLTLAARGRGLAIECGLLHSRFLKTDRQSNEDHWVSTYGAKGDATVRTGGRILVGTQVVEQSLDLDADFLVTRLAPTDLLLQRLGRLWRHRQNDPLRPSGCVPEAWIVAPTLTEVVDHPEATLGKSGLVYAPYVLLRTLEVWATLAEVEIPRMVRPLLEATYAERPETGPSARLCHDLGQRRQKLQGLARVGLSKGGKTLPERAATRYSEVDSVDVLLLRRIEKGDMGVKLTFVDGSQQILPTHPQQRGRPEWRRLARALQLQTVTVSEQAAPPPTPEASLGWLKPYLHLDDLRVALVDEAGDVRPLVAASPWGSATYSKDLGYQFQKGGDL